MRAGIAEQRGDTEEAATLFGQVAENEDAAPAMRDLARLRQVVIEYDEMDSAAIIAALKPLATPASPISPARASLLRMPI